jgi:hypothetical protein
MSDQRENPPPTSSQVFVRRQKIAPPPATNDPLDFLQSSAQTNPRPTSRHPSIADQPLPPPPLPLRNAAAAFASASQIFAHCVATGTAQGEIPCMTLLSIIPHAALSSIFADSNPNDLLQVPRPPPPPPTNQPTNFSTASQYCCVPFVTSF